MTNKVFSDSICHLFAGACACRCSAIPCEPEWHCEFLDIAGGKSFYGLALPEPIQKDDGEGCKKRNVWKLYISGSSAARIAGR